MQDCCVIIPALDEEASIGKVLDAIPKERVGEVIVVDNGSKDRTAEVARSKGATVVEEPRRGYGQACLAGLEALAQGSTEKKPAIVVFLDADFSDDPTEMTSIIEPIDQDRADMVIGSRALGVSEKGSLTIPQVFGNWLATVLLRLLYGQRFSDLGPFRAIRYSSLLELKMEDQNFGWTVEMQIKAAKRGLRCHEVPVSYRRRIGKSKISGTIKGSISAGSIILWTIYRYR